MRTKLPKLKTRKLNLPNSSNTGTILTFKPQRFSTRINFLFCTHIVFLKGRQTVISTIWNCFLHVRTRIIFSRLLMQSLGSLWQIGRIVYGDFVKCGLYVPIFIKKEIRLQIFSLIQNRQVCLSLMVYGSKFCCLCSCSCHFILSLLSVSLIVDHLVILGTHFYRRIGVSHTIIAEEMISHLIFLH